MGKQLYQEFVLNKKRLGELSKDRTFLAGLPNAASGLTAKLEENGFIVSQSSKRISALPVSMIVGGEELREIKVQFFRFAGRYFLPYNSGRSYS